MSSNPTFELNNRALVYQGPLLYEAKVLKVYQPDTQLIKYKTERHGELKESKPTAKFPSKYKSTKVYFVHYLGWSNKWDEWVLPSRMMEKNTESLLLQKNLKLKLEEEQNQLESSDTESNDMNGNLNSSSGTGGQTTTANGSGAGFRRSASPSVGGSVKNRAAKRAKHSNTANGASGASHNGGTANGTHFGGFAGVDSSFAGVGGSGNGGAGAASSKRRHGQQSNEFKIVFSDELKLILVDDWENITKLQKLVSLPGKVSINKVIQEYTDYINLHGVSNLNNDINESSGETTGHGHSHGNWNGNNSWNLVSREADVANFLEILASLRLYFNRAVGSFVLYRQERDQYKEMLDKFGQLDLCEVYTPVHLLRLLTVLPNLMFQAGMDPLSVKVVQRFLDGFLTWLDYNRDDFFGETEYENNLPLVM
ncbi:unnamed protein product [Ambrosiozyma monospora]|uniref:Unnamed protein product n=2 Tax=Ambrosiozyma monospora TaxID=43982 RepID=A0ACB5T672_AMBMO|nr:unnamed protein product [Ambrosiozyma monospora]